MDTQQCLTTLEGFYLEYHFEDENSIFQQDVAPCHKSKKVQQWFEEKGVNIWWDWPPQSPDLNPIEDIWDILDKAVQSRGKLPTSLPQLMAILLEEWKIIAIDIISKLYKGMPKRIQAVIDAEGGHTKY